MSSSGNPKARRETPAGRPRGGSQRPPGRREPVLTPAHQGPHVFRAIMRTGQALMAGLSRELGMSATSAGVLMALARADVEGAGGLGMGDLAGGLGVTPALVTRQVQDLERRGLVTRRGDPGDGRRTCVRLSAKGRRVFRELHERAHRLEGRITRGLSEADVETTCRVLSALRFALRRAREDGARNPQAS
jgi:MarR family transcriptional regulator, transcriptional regulator for hemolysin